MKGPFYRQESAEGSHHWFGLRCAWDEMGWRGCSAQSDEEREADGRTGGWHHGPFG
jgi:hypothetical protein